MIIQCSECQARFKLADEKIKPEGTKVRCSKCQHIFTVTPPEPEPETTPAEAAEPQQPSGPKLEVDFSAFGAEEDWDNFGETATENEAQDTSEDFALTGPGPEDQEEDQAFSFGNTEESSSFSAEDESTSEDEDFFATEPESNEFDSEKADADFGFGEPESNSFFSDEEEGEKADEGISFSDNFSGAQEDDFSWEEEPQSGGPNEFDFEDSAPAPGLENDFNLGEPAGDEPASGDFQFKEMSFDDEPLAPAASDSDRSADSAAPKAGRKAKKRAKKSQHGQRKSPLRGLMVFILLLLLALSAGAGYFFWTQGNLDLTAIIEQLTGQSPPPQPAGQIQVTELSSTFVNNAEAGQLFVIQGKAVNQYKEARSAIVVKGILYGQGGKQLLQQTVFCGNRLDKTKLQTWPFTKIEEAMNNQFGDSLTNLNVAPGATIPFTIVFKNLPKDLSEFTVEVADSKPGSKQ